MLTIATIIIKKTIRGLQLHMKLQFSRLSCPWTMLLMLTEKNKQGSEDENKRKRMLGRNEIGIELLHKHMGHMVQT